MARKNLEEFQARQWLEEQRYSDISDLSKDQRDPPDFLVEGRIGVEVRRLNWMTDTNRRNQGAEELEHALGATIGKILEAAGAPPGGYSVYVSCDLLHDSLPPKEVIQEQVRQAVGEYVDFLSKTVRSGKSPVSRLTRLRSRLDMHFYPYWPSGTGKFELGQVEVATPMRGWVVQDLVDNINRCIEEKTDKLKERFHLYPEWWLVLVDYNIYALGQHDESWQTVRDSLVCTEPWARIVVLSQTDPRLKVDMISNGNR